MLHLQIDPHSGVPVYRQMMTQIKYYAASGALKPGDRLPSIRDLARALAVNPATVVKAYGELQHEGVIEMKHGKGAFMCEPTPAMSQREQSKALQRLARQLVVEAAQMAAPAELVLRVVREEMQRVSKVVGVESGHAL